MACTGKCHRGDRCLRSMMVHHGYGSDESIGFVIPGDHANKSQMYQFHEKLNHQMELPISKHVGSRKLFTALLLWSETSFWLWIVSLSPVGFQLLLHLIYRCWTVFCPTFLHAWIRTISGTLPKKPPCPNCFFGSSSRSPEAGRAAGWWPCGPGRNGGFSWCQGLLAHTGWSRDFPLLVPVDDLASVAKPNYWTCAQISSPTAYPTIWHPLLSLTSMSWDRNKNTMAHKRTGRQKKQRGKLTNPFSFQASPLWNETPSPRRAFHRPITAPFFIGQAVVSMVDFPRHQIRLIMRKRANLVTGLVDGKI